MSGKVTLGSALEGESKPGNEVPVKENVLNTAFVLSLQNPTNPKEIAANNKNISRIGNLCDVPNLSKLNISFNKLLESLDGIEQIPSLKDFWCYGCAIRDLTGLPALSKAEVLLLQHNKIESIGDTFKNMGKLRELRLDGNRLKKIEASSFQSCQFLRRLDLSHNALITVDGLSGLQSLQELKLNNNKLTSISALRGLPQLTEIDVSHNYLKSLDGIQHFIKLEIVRANYNHMVHLQFQPYANNNASDKAGKATVLQTSSGAAPVNATRSNNKSSTSVKSNAKRGDTAASAAASTAATKSSVLPTLDKPVLTEVYLSGNKIRSIGGLEMYQHSLEILDVSRNQFTDVMNLTAVLRDSHALTEFYLYDNPCAEDVTQMTTLRNVLQANCPNFTVAFENVLLAPVDVDVEEMYHHPSEAAEEGGFHTWAHDESTVATGDVEEMSLLEKEKDAKEKQLQQQEEEEEKKKKKQQQQQLNEDAEDEDENEDINRMFLGPKPLLRSMLTQEQIVEKEQEFRHLLTATKEKLHRTVFQFLYPDKYTDEDTKNPYSKEIQRNNSSKNTVTVNQDKLDRDALTSAAADKIREVLAAVAKVESLPSATSISTSTSTTAKPPLNSNNNNKPAVSKLLRSQSSSSSNVSMPVIQEETLDSLLSPGKPPKLAQQPSHASLDIPLTIKDTREDSSLTPALSARSLHSLQSNHSTSNTSKTKKKLHAQISFSADLQSNNNNINNNNNNNNNKVAMDFEAMDISKLASNVTSHGSKTWRPSAVEKETQQQIRQAMTQQLLQTGVVAPEDALRHEEELLAFSTVKIAKHKPERKLLVDAQVNIVTTQTNVPATTQQKDEDTAKEGKEENEDDDMHPLSLSAAEKTLLERAVSTPLSQMVSRPMPLLFENETDDDDDDNDNEEEEDNLDKEATNEEESTAASIALPSVSFKPNSIGFDRRYLEDTDDITVGSAPVLLTPRDLSTMLLMNRTSYDNNREEKEKDETVWNQTNGKKTGLHRAHSAPLTRPESSTASLRTSVNTDLLNKPTDSNTNNSSSIPHTPVQQSTSKATVVGGSRVVPPMSFLAADVHTKSMSSLLKFQLPPDLQRMIDLEDAQAKESARTLSSKATPRSPGFPSARSTGAVDAKALSVSSSPKDTPLIFSDEDVHLRDNEGALDAKRSQVWSDPIAAGKEQWVERIEARIFALSTKEAKAAVQMTTTPHAQLPSPNLFHPQSR